MSKVQREDNQVRKDREWHLRKVGGDGSRQGYSQEAGGGGLSHRT